ncbi:hypothetical protein ZWY2020_040207, partial [Hordeum vulgare]
MLRSLRNLDHVPRSAYQSWIMARNIMGVKDKKNWAAIGMVLYTREALLFENHVVLLTVMR